MQQLQDYIQHANLLAGAVALSFMLLLYLVWLSGIALLPLVVFVVPLALYGYWQTFVKPWLWVALIAVGSFLGNIMHLLPEGVIPLTLFQLFLFTAVFSILLRRLIERDFNFRMMGFEAEIILFLGLIFLSLIWAPDAPDGFRDGVRVLISIFFLYLVFNEVKRTHEIKMVLIALVVVAVFLGAYGVYQNVTNVGDTVRNMLGGGRFLRGRVTGTTTDPNRFATMFFIPMAFTACIILSKKQLSHKVMAFVAFMVMSGGIIVTYSRSAWIGAILMLLIIAWYYRNVKLFAYLGLVVIAVLIAFPQFTFTLLNAAQRFLDITAGSADDSSRIRLLLGLAAIGMFLDSWFIGVGFRGFVESFTNYYSLHESIGVAEPHNVLYTVMAELGLIGIVLYGFIMFKIFRVAWLNIRLTETEDEKIIALTCFSTIVAFFVFYQFYGGGLNDNNFWLVCALAFSLYYVGKAKSTPDPDELPPAPSLTPSGGGTPSRETGLPSNPTA
ncbi:O-antigen ligase [Cyclonatronum proteinivorum]|uniref:O-antigen ligase n=1 Tax=Cyclonatronum proteinivorum TaxID=1457365 RepID=A0A345UGY3_9BACT|nr:O-antigen ligase family protein [Cyclonatronum proteinivorum]AXI99734.1 O-antigen ligase [Cyclonatronum proteinivorum]